MIMITPITISKTKMTKKDLDMGGGKRTKCEESSNSTSSYKEAAECVALGIMIVTCLVSTMFMVITTEVIMIKKKLETSKARLVRVERTPPTSPPPSTRRSTQRQTLRLVIIDFFPTQISNSDIFEARYHNCAKSKCFSTEPHLIG